MRRLEVTARATALTDQVAIQLHCEICLKKDQGEKMLICDGCDCGMERWCL